MASPKVQGQDTISVVIPASNAKVTSTPFINIIAVTVKDNNKTRGTKILAILSTILVLPEAELCILLNICDRFSTWLTISSPVAI